MNLILIFPEDLVAPDVARLTGRRLDHVRQVHRAAVGDDLVAGMLGGRKGTGRVLRLDDDALELALTLTDDPTPKLPLTLLIALPRPKVVNRVVASATSLGAATIVLINAWKVEKAYWGSPRLEPASLRHQAVLGLEQAGDTVLPDIRLARLFRPFVEKELPAIVGGGTGLLAHPGKTENPGTDTGFFSRKPGVCPQVSPPVVLAIGPEGGWIDAELGSFERAGFRTIDLGPRILRTETALAALVGKLF